MWMEADLDGSGVRLESLSTGEARGDWADLCESPRRKADDAHNLDEIGDRKRRGEARSPSRRHHVAQSRDVVPGGLWRVRANEDASGVVHLADP